MRFDLAVSVVYLISAVTASVLDGNHAAVVNGQTELAPLPDDQQLYKRRGGGGGGARGGGGLRGGGGSRSGSGGGGSRSGGSSGSRANTSPSSNTGGTSRGGTGPAPALGGGRFYGGGATRPFQSGGRSPAGIVPFALAGAALAFWPGIWLFGAHLYPYNYQHRFYNATTDRNETANVLCACSNYAVCGCDENNNTVYYDDLIGNGSYDALNKSIVNVGQYEGNTTLLINGTLPNGTTANGPDEETSAALRSLFATAGFWPAAACAIAAVFLA